LNARLIRHVPPVRVLRSALIVLAAAATTYLILVLTSDQPLATALACFILCVSSNGLIAPNAIAIALTDFPRAAGTAAALVGTIQFALAGIAAPLAWVGGNENALPMALIMASTGIAAMAASFAVPRPAKTAAGASDTAIETVINPAAVSGTFAIEDH
jgi:DHA1 family bicyclomycin/chloramphenicol resistance-like MFS transporter